jgi:ubiquinol-cytochrome c reductase cytochrome b subunit
MRFFAIKPQMFNFNLIFLFLLITPFYYEIKPKISRLKGIYRIGPHNKDVISIIFGSLLGKAQSEKRLLGVGTRISFSQEAVHVEYILFLHKLLSDLGYCNSKLPAITTRIGSKGKLRKIVRFST